MGGHTIANFGKILAICLNDQVLSVPNVNVVLSGGEIHNYGSFTKYEAEDLAEGMSMGNLHVPCVFVSMKKL